jgi:hypothetical protein
MEQSSYTGRTLCFFNRARSVSRTVGVSVQSYLRRADKDVEALIAAGAAVRLVKGVYNEPAERPTCSPSRQCDLLHRRLQQLRCLRRCFDCYRVERTSSRAGYSRCGPSPFHGAPGSSTYVLSISDPDQWRDSDRQFIAPMAPHSTAKAKTETHVLAEPHDVVGSPGIVVEIAVNARGEIRLAGGKAQWRL